MIRWLILLLAVLVARPAAAQDTGRFVDLVVPTTRIPPPRVTVWLPPGYNTGHTRYPVVYMHDGQTVFTPARAPYGQTWAAHRAAMRLAAAGRIAPVMVVAIDAPGPARWRTYFPQALKKGASPALGAVIDVKAGGPLAGDAYLAFLVHDLKPLVDRTWRTHPDPAHTALIGSSMGGLISCYGFTRYPRVFGRAACVSSHWPLAEPEALPWRNEVIGIERRDFAKNLGKPAGRRLWMDHGTEKLDALYAPYQQAIDAEIAALGWRKGRDFQSRVYPGAAHEERAWAARLDDILAWLFR